MYKNFGNSGGEGGINFEGRFWKIQRGGGVLWQIPSVGGGGGYGNFLEPHICMCFSGGDRVFVLDSLVMQETVFQCTVCTVEYSKLFYSVLFNCVCCNL